MTSPFAPPSEVVRPVDADALHALVREANGAGSALVVTSSGQTHFRDGLSCREPHRLVDLSTWKRIDLIDRRNRVCLIEPGVTYDEILAALAPHGMTIPMPLTPTCNEERGGRRHGPRAHDLAQQAVGRE